MLIIEKTWKNIFSPPFYPPLWNCKIREMWYKAIFGIVVELIIIEEFLKGGKSEFRNTLHS